MTSEHADGRAWDWGIPTGHGRAEAHTLLSWLFATDPQGNTQAMARRLGVMYVIWQGRIRSTGGGWQPYLPGVCWQAGKGGKVATGNPTLCHRDHVHISLAWDGAMKRTSFWTGSVAHVDYGPCVAPGKVHAPRYSTRPRWTACPRPAAH